MSNSNNPYVLGSVGLRFIPTDEELIAYFLLRKIVGISVPETCVLECDLYGEENPWEIWEKYSNRITFNPTDGSQDLYFFTKLKRRKPNAVRVERRVGIGTWQGEDGKTIIESETPPHICIGSKKRFRFEKSGTHHDTEWIMHEYSLNASLLPPNFSQSIVNELVLCRIRKNGQSNKNNNKGKKSLEHVADDHYLGTPLLPSDTPNPTVNGLIRCQVPEVDHSLNVSLISPNISNPMVKELVRCQIGKNEQASTNQIDNNDRKRKKSPEYDDADQSQCKLKKLRQEGLESNALDEETLLFTMDLEKRLLEIDEEMNQAESNNTVYNMKELFTNGSSSEKVILNSMESNEKEATGINGNYLHSLEVDKESFLFAADLERLLEFDQEMKQSEDLEKSSQNHGKTCAQEDLEPNKLDKETVLFAMDLEKELLENDKEMNQAEIDNIVFNMKELSTIGSSPEKVILNSTESNEKEATSLDESDLHHPKVDEESFLFALERQLFDFDQEMKQFEDLENPSKIHEKTCTQDEEFEVLITIDELLNQSEEFFEQIGDSISKSDQLITSSF